MYQDGTLENMWPVRQIQVNDFLNKRQGCVGYHYDIYLAEHKRELPVLHYHKIMVIYPYPFLVVIDQFLSWIIFMNNRICILTGSSG